jgi:class 3 adenylate cyclase
MAQAWSRRLSKAYRNFVLFIFSCAVLISSIARAQTPGTYNLSDPVPDLLSGPQVTTNVAILAAGGRSVQGVSADGVSEVVIALGTAYMDIHNMQGTTTVQVNQAHAADFEQQGKYGVEYLKYWFNESQGKAFCLVDAPSPEAAQLVHREAHGQMAERIIEVQPELVEAFLGGSETGPSGAALLPGAVNVRDPAIRTVLFTDIVGSTDEALGDDAGMALLSVHDRIVRDALAAADCREVKHTGDRIMASFVSAAAAVRCAVGVARALAKHQEEHTDYPLKVRIGVAAGEPVEREHDLFGATVQLAARLCSHAQPEQILVLNVVAELCLGKGLPFKELGDVSLKGFSRPVRVHVVEWSGAK